jgi:hypothetical protein
VAGLGLAACGPRQAGEPADGPAAAVAEQPPGATVTAPSGLRVSLASVRRAGRDVVHVDLLVVNSGPVAVDLAAAFGQEGGLPQAFLLSTDGRARVFVLADGGGVPQCSRPSGGLAPGAQHAVYLRFPAMAGAAHRVSLGVPGVGTLTAVDVPAADGA